jgi:hypothetical protein
VQNRENDPASFVIEEGAHGRDVVVTGPWSQDAAAALSEVDGLTLNYARGFCEKDLGFLREWPVRRLRILDRTLIDLSPIEVLAPTLRELSIQAAPEARLNLHRFEQLTALSGIWALLAPVLHQVAALQQVITWRFDEEDLRSFANHPTLERLTIKEAPQLVTLNGIARLKRLSYLGVHLAERLKDTTAVASLAETLQHLELESCSAVGDIADVEPLTRLVYLGVNECGRIESLKPLRSLRDLSTFHAWGTTFIVDCDLSPLGSLKNLREVRMRDRHMYEPRLSSIKAGLVVHAT